MRNNLTQLGGALTLTIASLLPQKANAVPAHTMGGIRHGIQHALRMQGAHNNPPEVQAEEREPISHIVRSHHDLLEYNNCYDEKANAICDQIIFWRWNTQRETYECIAWRLVPTKPTKVEKLLRIQTTVRETVDGIPRGVLRWIDGPIQEFRERETKGSGLNMIPFRRNDGLWESVWVDEQPDGTAILRITTFDDFIETWTQYDPELEDREIFPKTLRPDLPGPPNDVLNRLLPNQLGTILWPTTDE